MNDPRMVRLMYGISIPDEKKKLKNLSCHNCGNTYFKIETPEIDLAEKKATDLVEIYCVCSLCKTKYFYQHGEPLIKIV